MKQKYNDFNIERDSEEVVLKNLLLGQKNNI